MGEAFAAIFITVVVVLVVGAVLKNINDHMGR